MLDDVILFVRGLDHTTIYIFLFLIAYFENVIPPIPGDLPVAFVGSLIAIDDISFMWCLVWASVGSLFGFLTMYASGYWLGMRLYAYGNSDGDGKIKHGFAKAIHDFFPPESLDEIKEKFARYGYWLIIANRFMTGSRAIISISAGIAHLKPTPVTLSAAFSAVLWNILLLYGGFMLGDNWEVLGEYITTYGLAFTVIVLSILGVIVWRYIQRLRKRNLTRS